MNTIAERIQRIRKDNQITQQEFADRIGVKRHTVTQYEIGRNYPRSHIIRKICKEFDINENWLRTGEGDMLQSGHPDSELSCFIGNVMASDETDFRRRLITALAHLDASEWAVLEEIANQIAEPIK